MSDLEIGRLVYLVLLGSVLLTYLLVANRRDLGTMLRNALLWGLIFLGVVVGVLLWQDMSDRIVPTQAVSFGEGRIDLPRHPSGHYFATLEVQGTPVRFIVDTGATGVVLARADAEQIGIDVDRLAFTGLARTANGTVETARVSLDEVVFGEFRDRDVDAWVTAGELDISLLGMSYLSRFDRIEIESDRLVLSR